MKPSYRQYAWLTLPAGTEIRRAADHLQAWVGGPQRVRAHLAVDKAGHPVAGAAWFFSLWDFAYYVTVGSAGVGVEKDHGVIVVPVGGV